MHHCDTVLILGSTMPWINYYPTPGQARGVQVDLIPDRIGLRYPVEVGLVGDIQATLEALQPLLKAKTDRSFLAEAQSQMKDWNALLGQVVSTQKGPRLRPQTAMKALSDLAPSNAMFSVDCGTITHYAGRILQIRKGQSFTGTRDAGQHGGRPANSNCRGVCASGSDVDRHRGRWWIRHVDVGAIDGRGARPEPEDAGSEQ